ncbi:MAG: DMT family protein [Rhizomicrobium sp.]
MIFPILMLCVSNIFMTFAWYGQLKYPSAPVWLLILVGWGIAFFEYCFAVPANHYGQRVYSPVQLKTMQEVITLTVFAFFSVLYLGEAIRWNHVAAFGCLVLAAYLAFLK